VMGVFLTTVPMGTYAGFKLILGEVPPKHFRSIAAILFLIYLPAAQENRCQGHRVRV
jgi:hypothetical protein